MNDIQKLAADIAKTGVKQVFGIPGSGPSLTLLDELEKHEIRFYLTHIEATAVLMAGAIARLSGNAGVALGIKGPGLCNMLPGLAACYFENLPVVSITEAYTPDVPLTKAHKRIDHLGLVSSVAKGRRYLSKHGPTFLDLAQWAEAEVPAPVHLDIAASGSIENESQAPPCMPTAAESSELPGPVRKLLKSSKNPVIIAGSLAGRKRWHSRLNALQIPVFSVASAKGVVDETLAHAAGVYTGVGLEYTPEHVVLPKADLIISLGLRHHEVLAVKPFHCPSITIDSVSPSFYSGFQFYEIVDDSSPQVEALFDELSTKNWGAELLQGCFARLRSTLLSGAFLPAHVYHIIAQHVQQKARLVLDTGNFCTIGEHFWQVKKPDWYLSSGQGRYMGIGLPLAIGACLYDSSIPTIAILGDGSIGMFLADLKLAVQERLPLLVILMSDGHLGSVRSRALRDGITQKPLIIQQPSWQSVMEALGVPAIKVKSAAQLQERLEHWQPSEGPCYIEIMFDSENYQTMVKGVR